MRFVGAGRMVENEAVTGPLLGFGSRCRVVASRHVSHALAVSTHGVGH